MSAINWGYVHLHKPHVFKSACVLMENLLEQTDSLDSILLNLQKDRKRALEGLRQRDRLLGTATLSSRSLLTLKKLTRALFNIQLEEYFLKHPPSFSAEEKESILGHSAQKTISLKFKDYLLLCTSSKSFTLQDHDKLQIADALKYPNPKHILKSTINPSTINTSHYFGLAAGMVNPFLPPKLFHRYKSDMQKLNAVILLPEKEEKTKNKKSTVSISASLLESFVLPISHTEHNELVRAYLQATHPSLQVINL